MRILLFPATIALIDILILIPLLLAVFDVCHELWALQGIHEPMDIVEGMGVILIGWGVALEERAELREIFHLSEGNDGAWQEDADRLCHRTGIGLLVFGLFAEICIEVIRLPNRIINTQAINEVLVGISITFIAISGYILIRHVLALLPLSIRRYRSRCA